MATKHHLFFINEISKISNLIIIFENNDLKPNFKTKHDYEKKQFSYEKKKWFNNSKIKINKKLKFLYIDDINDINFVY